MIKITNHLYDESIKKNYLLYKFKNIIFETNDLYLVFILLKTRFLDPKKFNDIDVRKFKHEEIRNLENMKENETLFISKNQILWDEFILEEINFSL